MLPHSPQRWVCGLSTDVVMSANRNDLMLATLSAGPVGIGDALGAMPAETFCAQSVRMA